MGPFSPQVMYLPMKADESWRGGSNLKLVAKAREALSKRESGGVEIWAAPGPIVTFVPGEYLL